MLRAAGNDVRVFNAGVAGDTFAAMLARLDQYVPAGMQIAIVQGGYNDVQRRSDSGSIAASIQAIVPRLRARGVKVVLCGFFYPDWDALGAELAKAYGAVFVSGGACYDSAYRGADGSARRHASNGAKPTPQATLKRPLPACPSPRNRKCAHDRRGMQFRGLTS